MNALISGLLVRTLPWCRSLTLRLGLLFSWIHGGRWRCTSCFFVFETGSIHRPGCPGTHYVDQTSIELSDCLPMLGLKCGPSYLVSAATFKFRNPRLSLASSSAAKSTCSSCQHPRGRPCPPVTPVPGKPVFWHIWVSILFHHLGTSDETQVIRFKGSHLYPMSHLTILSLLYRVSSSSG